MPERSQHRESGGQDGRSERPAAWQGQLLDLGKLGKGWFGKTGKTGNEKFGSRFEWSLVDESKLAAATASRKRRPLSDDWSRRNAEARQQ